MNTFVAAADPASKVAYQFVEVGLLANAIKEFGFIPLRVDGAPFRVQEFEGGYLLDGAPINVWMGQGWFEGQRELLEPHWRNGTVPVPPDEALLSGEVEMPADVAASYAGFKQPTSGSNLMLGALIVGGYLLFGRKGKRA